INIKIVNRLRGNLLELLLPCLAVLQQPCADGIVSRTEFFDPLHQYLVIAQVTKCCENSLARDAHFLPGWVWIYCPKSLCHGAASADSNAKIVNRISVEAVSSFLCFGNDSLHPVTKSTFLRLIGLLSLWHRKGGQETTPNGTPDET